MRGSPLIRTVLVLLALVVSGIGFARLTDRGRYVPVAVAEDGSRNQRENVVSARYFLTLSAAASSVSLGGEAMVPEPSGEYSGVFGIERESPVVFLKVNWKEESGPRRFAKLVIEAAGEETFTHVFDASGDIDDFVELPF